MNIFVTGGTGLLGRNLIEILLRRNNQVTALVRSMKKGQEIWGGGVSLVEGDMIRVKDFADALTGHDALIHTAAYFTEFHRNGNMNEDGRLRRINVEGTVSLLEAAYYRGVKNAVYVSSSGVLAINRNTPADEKSFYAAPADNAYFQSKIDAERAVYRMLESLPDFRVVFILPAAMMGPCDAAPTHLGRFVLNYLDQHIPLILPGGMPIVDARDTAAAIVSALGKGNRGQRFVVGGRTHTMATIFSTLERASGVPAPTRKPSPALLKSLARVMETMSGITGKPPVLRLEEIRWLKKMPTYNSSAAENLLGIDFRPLEETINDTVRWFLAEGMVYPRIPNEMKRRYTRFHLT